MPVIFDVALPATGAELRRNVQHALSLGLPDLKRAPARRDTLSIIANGPSAHGFPFDERLSWPSRDALALNGARRLFGAHPPTWWAACDPQALVADFLDGAPAETTYLVASKCHPAVFDALKDRRVILWHLDEEAYWDLVEGRDPISVAPTVTICAFELGERLGFSRFATWGWDGCFIGRDDHACAQPLGDKPMVPNEVGGELFATTTSWMWEAQNAALRFEMTPRDVTIHGPGMIGAILRARDLLPGPPVWAEPGFTVHRAGNGFITREALA